MIFCHPALPSVPDFFFTLILVSFLFGEKIPVVPHFYCRTGQVSLFLFFPRFYLKGVLSPGEYRSRLSFM